MRLLTLVVLLLSARGFAQGAPWSRGESQGEDLVISLVTFGPGDDVPSYFGHVALVVEDRRLRQERLYNYGMFSFEEPGMLLKFIRGRLEFWVGEDSVARTLEFYRSLNRDITVQVLNLLPEAKVKLAKALGDNVLPQNRDYLYNHYFDNCSTRPRDLIDRAVDGQLVRATSVPGRMTLRQHTARWGWVDPFINLAMDYGLNDQVDPPIPQSVEAFIPAELMNQLDKLTYVNALGKTVPYVENTLPLYVSTRPKTPDRPPRYFWPLLVAGLLAGALPVLFVGAGHLRPRFARIGLGISSALAGLVMGILGTLVAFLWLGTNHLVAHHNENLFLTSPLALAAVVLGVSLARGHRKAAAARVARLWGALLGLALLGLLLKVLPAFDQQNVPFAALWLPVLLGLTVASRLFLRWQREAQPA